MGFLDTYPIIQDGRSKGWMTGVLGGGADRFGMQAAFDYVNGGNFYNYTPSTADRYASLFPQQQQYNAPVGDSFLTGGLYRDLATAAAGERGGQAAYNAANNIIASMRNNSGSPSGTGSSQYNNADLDPEDVAEARQEVLEELLQRRGPKRDFKKLLEKLESGNAEQINKALKELNKYKGKNIVMFAAFQKYVNDEGKDLFAILEVAEGITDVDPKKIDKVFGQYDDAEAWVNAEDYEEALNLNEGDGYRGDVSGVRQDAVERLLDKQGTQKRFEKLETGLESTDKDTANNAIKTFKSLSRKEIAAFEQYLDGKSKNLEDILEAAAKVAELTTRGTDNLINLYDDALEWLDATDKPAE